MKRIQLVIAVLIALSACRKEATNDPLILNAADYFPMEVGNYWIYQAEYINVDADVAVYDTLRFEMKMLHESFDDSLIQHRFERFQRTDSLSDWQSYDLVLISWDARTMQWYENNQRFVKMTRPVYDSKSWDGNIYNTLEKWNYYYTDLQRTFKMDESLYQNTIRIEKSNTVNVIQEKRSFEIMAYGIGPVYDYQSDFEIQAGSINFGFSKELKLLKFGQE